MHSGTTPPFAGPAVAGRPTRQRSKPAAFWLTSGAAASAGAPNYREVSASPSPCELIDVAEEAAADPAADVDPSIEGDACAGADDAATGVEPPQQPAAQDATGREQGTAAASGAQPAVEQPALNDEAKVQPRTEPSITRSSF
jgi:hypothetical protein